MHVLRIENRIGAFLATLRRDVWPSRKAAPAPIGAPQTRIVEAVGIKEYWTQSLCKHPR